MDVRAFASSIFISPQKLGLVCDKVRGLQAEQALVVLQFMPQKGAEFVHKLLASALANAENNFDLEREEMYISTIFAGDGPALKRFKAGARGRYKPRKRRMSHLTLVLSQREVK
ncbi:MAG: 50S ribosomal protein L22 [Chloroflexota bacterium]|jgi:large subunit ribosomal protein L22|nr:50S ribosomal protein L22 [Chloroflexota bacterium]